MKKDLSKICQLASNILIYVVSIMLLLSVWLGYTFFSVLTIAMAVITIIVIVLSKDPIKVTKVLADLNLYYYFVVIVLAISKLIESTTLFYIGIALFAVELVLYILFTFIIKSNKSKK